jgi:hypothetical protein
LRWIFFFLLIMQVSDAEHEKKNKEQKNQIMRHAYLPNLPAVQFAISMRAGMPSGHQGKVGMKAVYSEGVEGLSIFGPGEPDLHGAAEVDRCGRQYSVLCALQYTPTRPSTYHRAGAGEEE